MDEAVAGKTAEEDVAGILVEEFEDGSTICPFGEVIERPIPPGESAVFTDSFLEEEEDEIFFLSEDCIGEIGGDCAFVLFSGEFTGTITGGRELLRR